MQSERPPQPSCCARIIAIFWPPYQAAIQQREMNVQLGALARQAKEAVEKPQTQPPYDVSCKLE